MDWWRAFPHVLRFSFLVLGFTWCRGMNKNGHQDMEIFYRIRRIRKCDLFRESMSLGMGFVVSKAHDRTSLFLFLLPADQDVGLAFTSPYLPVCHNDLCHNDNRLVSETAIKYAFL